MSHCALPVQGEIINDHRSDWPLIELTLYGSRNETAKLAKRVNCALRTLPLRARLRYVRDPLAWAEAGIGRLPALAAPGWRHEGWLSTEEIARKLTELAQGQEGGTT